ncbi:MAG TPA: histidine ammonia-lyase, partial [Sorangium sp.]|nr:histidine ammonia-lyase [Sorangium sp.]
MLLGQDIRLVELAEVACRGRRVALCAQARAAVERARGAVEAIVAAGDDAPAVYGINTGFGALAETRIDAGDIATLQRNLVRSHACGVGPDLSEPQVRAMMVLRAQVVARGHSGV